MQNTINNTAINNAAINNAAANNNSKTKEFLATNILKHLSEDEIQNILKMKNDEVINLKKDGSVFFKYRLENFATAFENGLWTVRTEKLNTTIENAKNKVIYYNILNLRFNKFDKATALLLNKQNENLVSEVYSLNENDFKSKCKEYNVD